MLTSNQRKFLKGKAHALKPVVQLGQRGLTEALGREIDRALTDHELIKVKVGDAEVPEGSSGRPVDVVGAKLAEESGAELVATVGKVAILYRRHPDQPRLRVPAPRAPADDDSADDPDPDEADVD